MSTSGLAVPPRAERQPVQPPDSKPPLPPNFQIPRRDFFEGVLGRSILGSVLLHLVLILLAPRLHFESPLPPDVREREIVTMEILILEAPPTTIPDQLPVPPRANAIQGGGGGDPSTVLNPPQGGNDGPVFQQPETGNAPATSPAGVPGPRGRDPLQPGYGDSRLYVTPDPFPGASRNRTPNEIYAERLQARINAVNDSIAAGIRRDSNTRDWMFGRWGLAADGLHLGGVTIPRQLIPSPAPTGDNMTREAGREQQRQRDEIQRQEAERERRRIQDERARATRDAAGQRRSGGAETTPDQ